MICVCHGLLPCDRAPLDLAEDGIQQRGALRREGALIRLRHVAPIHGPSTLPTAIAHRAGLRSALLPYLLAQGNKDAVTPDRERFLQ
jgi:hypothetical protein